MHYVKIKRQERFNPVIYHLICVLLRKNKCQSFMVGKQSERRPIDIKPKILKGEHKNQ
jgi:hypothetical protein